MINVELLQADKSKIGILSAYPPPGDLNCAFNDNLKFNLKQMWDNGMHEIIITGDFNLIPRDRLEIWLLELV